MRARTSSGIAFRSDLAEIGARIGVVDDSIGWRTFDKPSHPEVGPCGPGSCTRGVSVAGALDRYRTVRTELARDGQAPDPVIAGRALDRQPAITGLRGLLSLSGHSFCGGSCQLQDRQARTGAVHVVDVAAIVDLA